jgi:predicted DNA-binding transcriptional regulator AlpA
MRLGQAAAYLSMSPASFLRLVDEGIMPAPIKIKGMAVWDRFDIEGAFENLKHPDASENTMHKILGIKS